MINSTQLVVRTDVQAIKWLERKGYRNILPKNYAFSVFTSILRAKPFSARTQPAWQRLVLADFDPKFLTLKKSSTFYKTDGPPTTLAKLPYGGACFLR